MKEKIQTTNMRTEFHTQVISFNFCLWIIFVLMLKMNEFNGREIQVRLRSWIVSIYFLMLSINFLQEFDLKRKRNENIRGITRGILYIN